MSICPITSGRTEPCNDSIGGLTSFIAIPYAANAFTITGSQVTAIDSGITEAFKFELRADANIFNFDGVSDENTGTSVFNETLTVALKKLDKDSNIQIELLQKGLHYIIPISRNGGYQIMGSTDGARVTASNNTTGGARTDFNGYNVTATSVSKIAAPFFDATTITALEAIVSDTNINP